MPFYTIAVDLGASGGRLMLGEFDGETVKLSEIHRFANEPVKMNNVLYWDTFRLFHEIKQGFKKVAALGVEQATAGVDTWGVDYCLMDNGGNITGMPIHYRDARTDDAYPEAEALMPLDEIYKITGIQFMKINTIFQLRADARMRPGVLYGADRLLMMPDLVNFLLSGEKYNEYTILSTTQLMDARKKRVDAGILNKLQIPEKIFADVIFPGQTIGAFTKETREETGLKDVTVIAVGSHDTASAVAGTPFDGRDAAFISCGTWSLLGAELPSPIITDDSFKYNFTNEGGVEGTVRFLKNINGLWIIQQLRKHYNDNNGTSYGFADICEMAKNARDKHFTINTADDAFTAPPDMQKAIAGHLIDSGQGAPDGLGEMAASVYNGLTDEYKNHVENLQKLTGKRIDVINMIGGGIQDTYLCELSALKTGKTIEAGPVEASILGNMIMQLIAAGEISNLSQGRAVIGNSFGRAVYTA